MDEQNIRMKFTNIVGKTQRATNEPNINIKYTDYITTTGTSLASV